MPRTRGKNRAGQSGWWEDGKFTPDRASTTATATDAKRVSGDPQKNEINAAPPEAGAEFIALSADGSQVSWRLKSGKIVTANPRGEVVARGGKPIDRAKETPISEDEEVQRGIGRGRRVVDEWHKRNPLAAPALDITAGEYEDYFGIAREIFRKLGVLGRDPSDEEIVFFAKNKMNADTVEEYYRFKPDIVKEQPGLPYYMSKPEYEAATREFGDAFRTVFSSDAPGLPDETASKEARSANLIGRALTDRIGVGQFSNTLETFRQERGRAPSTAEFIERMNRPAQRTSAQTTIPHFEDFGPQGRRRGGPGEQRPRPAISG